MVSGTNIRGALNISISGQGIESRNSISVKPYDTETIIWDKDVPELNFLPDKEQGVYSLWQN